MRLYPLISAILLGVLIWGSVPTLPAAEKADNSAYQADPARGYRLLTEKAYLPPDFDQETFDELWKCWEEPLRSKAAAATEKERTALAFTRYGLTPRPNDPTGKPLQYVVDEAGRWSMNCFACHGGEVAGRVIPGLPNTHYALETLVADVRLTKIRLGKKLTHMDLGSLIMPLGTTNGTTNAVMFGVALLNYRDENLNIIRNRPRAKMTHHDHDAPPFWNVKYKDRLYADNFAPRNHRALMQFLLVEQNGPEKFRRWENDYRDISAYIESLNAPSYPFEIDQELAVTGRAVFLKNCSECHGTYGKSPTYPERLVPLETIRTDSLRLQALTVQHRRNYSRTWFAKGSAEPAILDPKGYVAPPLHGIWASAPYFHNGAVPTLWHLLHPEQRPVVWQQDPQAYDQGQVGLKVKTFDELPSKIGSSAQRRTFFDTRVRGKSAAGHDFPAKLNETERNALLEYLKTL